MNSPGRDNPTLIQTKKERTKEKKGKERKEKGK